MSIKVTLFSIPSAAAVTAAVVNDMHIILHLSRFTTKRENLNFIKFHQNVNLCATGATAS